MHKDIFEKFEIKNYFINIFLRENLKQLMHKQLKSKKEVNKLQELYTV